MLHRHKFEIADVEHYQSASYCPLVPSSATAARKALAADQGDPITKVLYRCTRCPKVKVNDLDGTWTKAQLAGEVQP